MRKIILFFDKFEDKVRHALSRVPIVYALIGGVGIVLFWRGVWHLADDLNMSSLSSFVASLVILLATGTFVSFFIGEQILISGLRDEKRIDEKTEEEIRSEKERIQYLKEELDEIKRDVKEVRASLARDPLSVLIKAKKAPQRAKIEGIKGKERKVRITLK